MSEGEILSYVNLLLTEWGIMPFIKVMLTLVTVIGAISMIRRLAGG